MEDREYDSRYIINETEEPEISATANPLYSVSVNIAARRLSLLKNGTVLKGYPVAVGKPATPTPKGTFRIINKAINPGGPFGVLWFGLSAPGGSYGIHGTNDPSSIGKNVSNGCIRLHNKDVTDLAKYIAVGTSVNIY